MISANGNTAADPVELPTAGGHALKGGSRHEPSPIWDAVCSRKMADRRRRASEKWPLIPTLVGAELQTAPLSGAPQAMSVGLLSCDAGLNVDSHRYGFAVLGRTTHPFTLGILHQL